MEDIKSIAIPQTMQAKAPSPMLSNAETAKGFGGGDQMAFKPGEAMAPKIGANPAGKIPQPQLASPAGGGASPLEPISTQAKSALPEVATGKTLNEEG